MNLSPSIHDYCETIISTCDFDHNQVLIAQLQQFLMDWNNINQFKALIENDGNANTTFVLYELLHKALAAKMTFQNLKLQKCHTIEDIELQDKARATETVLTHFDIAINYARKFATLHPPHVINTVLFSMAYLLRKSWGDIINPNELVNKLLDTLIHSNQLPIGCQFFDYLLNCIRSLHYASGYLEFRRIMIDFQRESLGKIVEATHNILVIHLERQSLIQIPDPKFTLIQLLSQLVNFNFNLSYEIDIQDKEPITVNFPDSYSSLLSNALILQKLFEGIVQFYPKEQSFLLMEVMQKIVGMRQSIIRGKGNKSKTRATLWQGVSYLLQNQQLYIDNVDFCNEFHQLVQKLIMNFGFSKLQKFKGIFDQVMQQLNQFTRNLLEVHGFKLSFSNVFVKAQQLWTQIQSQLQLQSPLYNQEYRQVKQCQQENFELILALCLRSNIFSQLSEVKSLKKLQKLIKFNFDPFSELFENRIKEYVELLRMQFQIKSIENYTTLICLVCVFGLKMKLDRTQGRNYYSFMQTDDNSQFNDIWNQLLINILELINYQVGLSNDFDRLYHYFILIFMENFILTTIDNLQYQDNILITLSTFYSNLNYHNNYLIVIENVLCRCLQFFQFDDLRLVEHSLKLIELIFTRVKRQITRKIFIKLPILNQLQQFFYKLNLTCFDQIQFIRKRCALTKLISHIMIDDEQDDYIANLSQIYKQIKGTCQMDKIGMLKYIWDVIGIAQQISSESILRIFLRLICSDLTSLLTQENLAILAQDYDTSVGLFTLLITIFQNKCASENVQLILYQVYGQAMNFFIAQCDHLLSTVNLKQTSKFFKLLSSAKTVNVGFFVIYETSYLNLFYKEILLIHKYRPLYKDYPKYKYNLLQCLESTIHDNNETLAYKCDTSIYVQLYLIIKGIVEEIYSQNCIGDEQIKDYNVHLALVGNILCDVNIFMIEEGVIGDQEDIKTIRQKLVEIYKEGNVILKEIFEMSFQLMIRYFKNIKLNSLIPDILFGISAINPIEVIVQSQLSINTYLSLYSISSSQWMTYAVFQNKHID